VTRKPKSWTSNLKY